MKKNFIYALWSAMALVSAAGFTACASDDEIVNNPDYDPETNSVKTEFTISLPNYVGQAATRQTDAITQVGETPDFRGMTDIWLIGYASKVTAGTQTPFNTESVHNLPAFSGFDKNDQNAKVYNTLTAPVGTGAFMFYAKATETDPTYPEDASNEVKTVLKKFHNGVLNGPNTAEAFTSKAASTFNFNLERIYDGSDVNTTSNTKGSEILTYIKGIRAAVSSVSNASLHAYLTNFKPTAGSSASIQAAVQKLWTSATATSDEAGKTAIKNAIEKNGDKVYASIDDNGVVTLTHQNLLDYPANLNLPDGAAIIDWSTDSDPKWATQAFGEHNIPSLENYVYPAALYYRANTPVGISDNSNVSKNYGSYKWTDTGFRSLYTWNQTVKASTRSIALENQIQYAVGRLDLTIKASDGTLYDAKGAAVTVPDEGFPVSAVLVGKQGNVGYDFIPSAEGDYTIYDKIMNNSSMAAKSTVASAVNHTLVLETLPTTKVVYVAVELTNNTGNDFAGNDGIVPAGGKFYLVGKLDLDATSEITQPSENRSKIFEQDYITKVDLTISQGEEGKEHATGLGGAYNVIPNLKDAELEVAFSVNLSWQDGLTFKVNI